jgi:hypothetical protein
MSRTAFYGDPERYCGRFCNVPPNRWRASWRDLGGGTLSGMKGAVADAEAVVAAAAAVMETSGSVRLAVAEAIECLADILHETEPDDAAWIAARLWLRFNASLLRDDAP